MTEQQHALYRFYSPSGQLLYVGITVDPGNRWKAHAKSKPWWHDVANVTVTMYPSREAVLDAERAAILAEHPQHNVVHNRGRVHRQSTPAATASPTKATVGPYDDDENLWTFTTRHGYERTMPLYLSWEVSGSPMSDDYYVDEADADELLRFWGRRYGDDVVNIYWSIMPICETAPYQFEPWITHDFLSYFTWPHHPDTDERLNFLRLPVLDFGWNHERSDKGGFIQEATGWKPSPLQPVVHTDQLFAAAGLARPTYERRGVA